MLIMMPPACSAAVTEPAQLGDAVQGLLDRHLLEQRDEVHGGLRRADHLLHGVGVAADRPDPGQAGYLGGHVEEPADPAGRRRVHDDRVVDALAAPSGAASPRRPCRSAARRAGPARSWSRSPRRRAWSAPCRRAAGCRTSRGTRSAPTPGRRPARTRRRPAGWRWPARPRPCAPRRAAAGSRRPGRCPAVPRPRSAAPASRPTRAPGPARRRRSSCRCPPLPVTTCSRTPSQSVSRALTPWRLSAPGHQVPRRD